MQQLCDKLAVAERTTKAKAQLKEKYQMRFKVLGERLKKSNGNSWENHKQWIFKACQSLGGAENFSKSSSNGYLSKRTSNSQYGLLRSNSASTLLKKKKKKKKKERKRTRKKRSLLAILQQWAFNGTIIIMNKWIFQVLFHFSCCQLPFVRFRFFFQFLLRFFLCVCLVTEKI